MFFFSFVFFHFLLCSDVKLIQKAVERKVQRLVNTPHFPFAQIRTSESGVNVGRLFFGGPISQCLVYMYMSVNSFNILSIFFM